MSNMNDILRGNNIPKGASIFSNAPDPKRTTQRYRALDDTEFVLLFNERNWYVTQYRQVKAWNHKEANFKPYMAIYQNFMQPPEADGGQLTIVQTNSHDGTQSLTLSCGYYNPNLDVHLVIEDLVVVKHHGDISKHTQGAMVDNALQLLPLVQDKIRAMKKIEMSYEDALEFARNAMALRFQDKYILTPEIILNAAHTRSLWEVLLDVYQGVFRGEYKLTTPEGKTRKTRPITSIQLESILTRGIQDLLKRYSAH